MNKLFLLLTLAIVSNSFAQTNVAFKSEALVDSILQTYCQMDEPGMALGIVQEGRVVYKKAIGTADLTINRSLSESTVFNIASVSKQFTACLALIAVEEGKISLDDDISRHLPELKNLTATIRVKQLANHTHGLPNYSNLIELLGFGLEDPITNTQAVKILLNTKQTNFEPGAQFQYGNSGFLLLAEILKRVYDKPFPDLVDEKIFTPLGMQQSRVVANQNEIVPNRAIAYTKRGEAYVEFINRQMENGSSNLHTSLNDFLKWMINFQNPTIGNRELFDKMIAPTTLNDQRIIEYGLGLQTEKYKGLDLVFHGGGTAGNRAYVLHVPAHNLSIVTLGNQESFDGLLIAYQLVDELLAAHLQVSASVKTSYTAEELEQFAGTYKFQPGSYWTITANENNLYFGDDPKPIPIIGDGKFVFVYRPTAYLTFRPNAMDFRIADFTYTCEKINLDPPALNAEALEKYAGIYRNVEYNTFYELLVDEDQLIAKHQNNGEIILQPLAKSSFYAESSFFGELDFKLNTAGKVSKFILAGQNFRNIEFVKLNE